MSPILANLSMDCLDDHLRNLPLTRHRNPFPNRIQNYDPRVQGAYFWQILAKMWKS